jgi:hypothetical protein
MIVEWKKRETNSNIGHFGSLIIFEAYFQLRFARTRFLCNEYFSSLPSVWMNEAHFLTELLYFLRFTYINALSLGIFQLRIQGSEWLQKKVSAKLFELRHFEKGRAIPCGKGHFLLNMDLFVNEIVNLSSNLKWRKVCTLSMKWSYRCELYSSDSPFLSISKW